MSYYGPAFANIQSGWYRSTSDPNYADDRDRINAVWDSSCDEIIRKYVSRYGTFFTAYDEDILMEVERASATNLKGRVRYYMYFFATRAWEMEDTRQQWLLSHRETECRSYRCATCESTIRLVDTHPELIRRYGIDLQVCRTCDYVLRRYDGLGQSVLAQVPALMRSLAEARPCELCRHSFDLQSHTFTYQSSGSKFVDLLYPNLFAQVCPKCFDGAFRDYRRGRSRAHLARLYELFLLTGRVPTQDFDALFYSCRDHDSILRLIELLKKTRTPHGYAEEFGSFFAALVASGILPDGSKKMMIGTMVLAKDGHLCLSIPEKEIDDFLCNHGLAHDKEASYPDCGFRCDWEVFAGRDRRVFIEYFGLMGNPDYAHRAHEKIALARSVGIELVPLYPDSDWMTILSDKFGLTTHPADGTSRRS
jgi:hypothetical protein